MANFLFKCLRYHRSQRNLWRPDYHENPSTMPCDYDSLVWPAITVKQRWRLANTQTSTTSKVPLRRRWPEAPRFMLGWRVIGAEERLSHILFAFFTGADDPSKKRSWVHLPEHPFGVVVTWAAQHLRSKREEVIDLVSHKGFSVWSKTQGNYHF